MQEGLIALTLPLHITIECNNRDIVKFNILGPTAVACIIDKNIQLQPTFLNNRPPPWNGSEINKSPHICTRYLNFKFY